MRPDRQMTLRQKAMWRILVLGMLAGKDFFDADFGNRKGATLKMGRPSPNSEGRNQYSERVGD